MKLNCSAIELCAGPAAALILYIVLPATFVSTDGATMMLSEEARVVLAVTLWMALWWIREVVPMAITALLPVTLFPVVGVAPFKTIASAYAHPLIFLFFAGFLVSIAVQKWQLHKRFALFLLSRVGRDPRRIVGGFMFVTASLSMWLSNTATAIMMLPIALSLIDAEEEPSDFAPCLLLAIAYSASIGGMATLIGTPPNLFVASYLSESLAIEVGFLQWLAVGLPCVVVLLPMAWVYLARIKFSLARSTLAGVTAEPASFKWRDLDCGARVTLIVFGIMVSGWLTRGWLSDIVVGGVTPFAGLSDAGIALFAAMLLFVVPVSLREKAFVLDWQDTTALPWGTLIMFGGGLSLAAAISRSGADVAISSVIALLPSLSPFAVLSAIVVFVVFLTELTSNIATTATFVPIFAVIAAQFGLQPVVAVAAVALAASCAFMLPVATPPNAIVYGSGRIRSSTMAATGFALNIAGIVVVAAAAHYLLPFVLA